MSKVYSTTFGMVRVAPCFSIRRSVQPFSRNKHSGSSKRWLLRQEKDPYAKKAREDGIPSRAYYKLEEIDSGFALNKKRRRSGGDAKGRLFSKGQTVLELGAAPGGWSLYAASRIGKDGTLLALDLLPLGKELLQKLLNTHSNKEERSGALPVKPSPFFNFYEGDFRSEEAKLWIINALANLSSLTPQKDNPFHITETSSLSIGVDVVMSDMAANFTGDSNTDAIRTMTLCEEALLFAIGSDHYFGPENGDETQEVWRKRGVLKNGGTFLCKYFTSGPDVEGEVMEVMKRQFRDVKVVKPSASRKDSSENFALATGFKASI